MIRLDEAQFSFGLKPILENVSLLLPEGSRVGLLGRNGAGKTTLFRLILGELSPESGSISVPRGRRIVYLPQHPDAPSSDTILKHVLASHPDLHETEEQILRVEEKMSAETDPLRLDRLVERHRSLSRDFEARGGYELEARVAAILEGLGFAREDLLKEIGPLSPGEKNRVALAKVLLAQGDVLLLDEPTNHLDFGMVEWLEEFLRNPPRGVSGCAVTVVVASHDRWFLNKVADHVCELRSGGLHLYRGNYDDFALQRAEEIERQGKVYRFQQADIAKDLEFIRRNFAAQKAKQAKSREKRLARMEVAERPDNERSGPRIRFTGISKAGDDVLRADDLSCGYPGETLFSDGRLEIVRGERVAILGPNGCGKTTLLKCLVGRLAPLRGKIKLGQRTVIGYYEQEHSRQGSEQSIFDEVHDLMPKATNQDVLDLLAAFLFRGDEIRVATSTLSGGEKARLALLRLIISGSNFLVLDEPTNHLDVYARAALEESLLEFPETILFVSHDRYFIERVADRVIAVDGGLLREFMGGYEAYRNALREEATDRAALEEAERRAKSEARGAPAVAKASVGLSKKAEEKLLDSISKAELAIKAKHDECGLETSYKNPEVMKRLKGEITDLEGRVAELYRQWEASTG